MLFDVPAVIGRQLPRHIGHQRALRGAGLFHHIQKIRRRIALHIQLASPLRAQALQWGNIIVARMALVRARVQGDAGGAQIEKARGKREQIREVAAARVAQQGDFIDVDGELGHGRNEVKVTVLAAIVADRPHRARSTELGATCYDARQVPFNTYHDLPAIPV